MKELGEDYGTSLYLRCHPHPLRALRWGARHGADSMPETAENVALEFKISRADQDAFALRSQARAAAAIEAGRLAEEIVPVTIPAKKGEPIVFAEDEHPRATTLEALAKRGQ